MYRIHNIRSAFKQIDTIFVSVFSAALISFIMFYFTETELIKVNIGWFHALSQNLIQVIISIVFGLNMGLLWSKLKFASSVGASNTSSTILGGALSVLVSGCPACSITVASYLGLASLFSGLPWFGLELKIIGLLLLLYSTNSLAKSLYSCKLKI